MNIGILNIGIGKSPDFKVSAVIAESVRLLELKGHDVKTILSIAEKENIKRSVEFLKNETNALIIVGDCAAFCASFEEEYTFPEGTQVFEAEGLIYLLDRSLSAEFIKKTAIPALNSKAKTFYTSAVFKTFGENAEQLRKILAECIKNKNRIEVRLVELPGYECEVRVRYSNKTQKPVVDALLVRTAELLKDCTYSIKDETLAETVMDLLKLRGQKLCLVESFTGGGVAKALIAVPGASAVIKEGLVTYSNEAKIKRLNVESQIIEHYGAVSIETVYEMAANILMSSDCDYAVATTGNAGPTAEREGGEGLFFVAIGNRKGIHIYQYQHSGTRAEIIEFGIHAAMFRLYKKMTESEFTELVKQHGDALQNT